MKTYINNITVPNPIGSPNWELSGLTAITAIFGKNGSGKSVLLRSWRDRTPGSHYIVPERGGRFDFHPTHALEQLGEQGRRGQSSNNFVNEYRSYIIARMQSYFTARGEFRRKELPGSPDEIEEALSKLLPDFKITITAKPPSPVRIERVSDGQQVQNIDALSSGETQILSLGIDLLTIAALWELEDAPTRIVFIDEPDAHIHPDLQVRFADFVAQAAKRYKLQIVVATHSTSLLAALGQFSGDQASVIYLDRLKAKFQAAPFNEVLKELSACLGGHALMGPLFGIPLLLVEGDDDYRIWSQVPRHHVVSFSVIPTQGGDELKRYQKSLEKIFAALRDNASNPAGFALLDGDKGKPEPNEHAPQHHVKFIKLDCHEAENLYLTDEVLKSMGLDWTAAAATIVSKASDYGNKKSLLETAKTWDRKTVDLKNVIEEISSTIDDKKVHWTIRVAKTIGNARPSGQLAEFLNTEVVAALWGPVASKGCDTKA